MFSLHDFGSIYEEAMKRKKLRPGVGGQHVTAYDGDEFWCALVAYEKGLKDALEWQREKDRRTE